MGTSQHFGRTPKESPRRTTRHNPLMSNGRPAWMHNADNSGHDARWPRSPFARLSAILLVAVAVSASHPQDASDARLSVCRVKTAQGRGQTSVGTGSIVSIGGGRPYVLTNAHVADGGPSRIELFRSGYKSISLPCETIFSRRTTHIDVAVLRVLGDLSQAGAVALPLDPTPLVAGQEISSMGCPEGEWPSIWWGHVTRSQPHRIEFVPPPIGGRSGSPVLNAEANKIVGLVAWRSGDDSHGIAMPVGWLVKIFRNEVGDVSRLPTSDVKPAVTPVAQLWQTARCVHGVPLSQQCFF